MDKYIDEIERIEREHIEITREMAKFWKMKFKQIDYRMIWWKLGFGFLKADKDQSLEDMVAVALRYGLKHPSLKSESIRLRQKLVDREGLVFWAGYTSEVDLIAENEKLTVFEVKATARTDDVYLFAQKIKLIAAQNPDQVVKGVLISLGAPDDVRQHCIHYGIELVS